MKFEQRDIALLKNFASINQSIIFRPGDNIKTVSQSKSVFAIANISTAITDTFAIYSLAEFLSYLSLIPDAEFTFASGRVISSGGKSDSAYACADPSLILGAPDKVMKLPTTDVSFELTKEAFDLAIKAASTLNLPEIAFVGDGKNVYVSAVDSKNKNGGSNFRQEVGETNLTFKLFFLVENLPLLPGTYAVDVCAKGFAQFTSDPVTYWVAVESYSEFPKQ